MSEWTFIEGKGSENHCYVPTAARFRPGMGNARQSAIQIDFCIVMSLEKCNE